MKKKYLIASHGNLATGLQSSLDILADKGNEFEIINAYVTDEDYTPKVISFIESVSEDEQAIIFTDLFGGSVNQKIVTEVLMSKKETITIISNVNLAIILSVLFSEESYLTDETLNHMISESQVTLVSTKLDKEEESIF